MTRKTIKTILFGSLIAAMILPFSGMMMAEAAPSDNARSDKGKTIVLSVHPNELIPLDNAKVKQINAELRKELSNSDRDNYHAELNKMEKDLKAWQKQNHNPQKEKFAREKQVLLGESDLSGIPITTIGYDYANNALRVTIVPEQFTDDNINNYVEKIRNIVGNDVDLSISPYGIVQENGCSNRTAYCDEPEGGMKYSVAGWSCTMGFRATLNGDTGFVTAGHCVEGEETSTAYMPTSSGTDIGEVILDVYDDNSDDKVYCDCAFIETDEDDTEMSDNVYGSANPSSAGAASLYSQVKLSGMVSGIEYGYVLATNVYTYNPNTGITKYNLVETSYDAALGDSGGPVLSSTGSVLHGIHSSSAPTGTYGYYVQEDQIRASVSNTGGLGITWDF